MFVASSRPTAL